MDVVIALLWLAAIFAVLGWVTVKLWRNKTRVVKFLLCAAVVAASLFLFSDELIEMGVWYLAIAAGLACAFPALLIIYFIFRKRLKLVWARLKAWWKQTGTMTASLFTFAILVAVYMFFHGAVWLLPILVLGFLFRTQLRDGWVALRATVRSP